MGVDGFLSTNVSFSRPGEHLSNEHSSFNTSTASGHSPIELSPTSKLILLTNHQLRVLLQASQQHMNCHPLVHHFQVNFHPMLFQILFLLCLLFLLRLMFVLQVAIFMLCVFDLNVFLAAV